MGNTSSTTVDFDIADWGKTCPSVPLLHSGELTIRLTNKTKLTTMPGLTLANEDIEAFSFVICDHTCSSITSIEGGFLSGCSKLKSVDLRELNNLTSVGYNFLGMCSSMTTLLLSPLSHVKSVGSDFLFNCASLRSVDLHLFRGVSNIENSFLDGCSSLTFIDLGPLGNVKKVGDRFLGNCCGLTSLDLSPLCGVTTVKGSFLYACSRLESITLPLKSLTTVGDNFLSGCYGLTTLDLTALEAVTMIGINFLDECGDEELVVSILQSQHSFLFKQLKTRQTVRLIVEERSCKEQEKGGHPKNDMKCCQPPPREQHPRNVQKHDEHEQQVWDVENLKFDKLKSIQQLGGGGQGTVTSFLHLETGRDVAVKCAPTSDPKKTLRGEYEKLAKLNHPNIVRVFHFMENTQVPGRTGRQDCIFMEHATGSTASLTIRQHRVTTVYPEIQQWLDVALQTLRGLETLHQNKMLHNDLKPGNVLSFCKGQTLVYKLADFGLALEVEHSTSATTTLNEVKGSRCYIAPEVIQNQEYSSASDVYAWACTMGCIATGITPKLYEKAHDDGATIGYTRQDLMREGTRLPVTVAEHLLDCFKITKRSRPTVKVLIQAFEEEAAKNLQKPL